MKRYMDLIRELLLEIEGGKTNFAICPAVEQRRPDQEEAWRHGEHLHLLEQAKI